MATTRISPALFTVLLVLLAITGLFVVLLFKETGRIDELLGTTDRKNSVPGMQDELKTLRASISANKATAAQLQREIDRLDLNLGFKRIYMSGDHMIAGVATASSTTPLPESSTALTRGLIQQASKRLSTRAESVAGENWLQSPNLSALISERQERLATLNKEITDLESSWREDEDKLKAQKKKLEATLDKGKKQQNDSTSTRHTKILQMEDQIREFLDLKLRRVNDLDPVGHILEAGSSKRVIINLGAQDKIQPGMKFEVFQYDRGQYVEKGMLEVVEVRPQIALCHVLNITNNKTWPIAVDDFIGNPVFSIDRPKVIVVAGDFTNYNRSDIENFLRHTGAEVRERLSPGVDFLIEGKNCGEQIDRAREYQVQVMDEARVLKYLRTEFRPNTTAAK